MPRDLDPAIGSLPGCTLFDLDALGSVAQEAAEQRDEATERAEAVVREEAEQFLAWLEGFEARPVVAALRRRADEIRTAELARADGRLSDLTPAERASVERLTAQIVNKLLHEPTVRAKDGSGEYADALRHLFALERG